MRIRIPNMMLEEHDERSGTNSSSPKYSFNDMVFRVPEVKEGQIFWVEVEHMKTGNIITFNHTYMEMWNVFDGKDIFANVKNSSPGIWVEFNPKT